jgi:hypothetical protein
MMSIKEKIEAILPPLEGERFEEMVAQLPEEEQEDYRALSGWFRDNLLKTIARHGQARRAIMKDAEDVLNRIPGDPDRDDALAILDMLDVICPVVANQPILAAGFIHKTLEMGGYVDIQTIKTLTEIQLNYDRCKELGLE